MDGREKRFKQGSGTDCHYGPQSQNPDLLPHVFEQLWHLEELLKNAENCDKIKRQTRGQSDCEL